ncbi:MAG: PEP-CTERM sorting domain-containing protein [Pseudomonadota bacterium]|nr:PEP-CTERM sorting domain-containing protein [Pseudomonadota bacterium]
MPQPAQPVFPPKQKIVLPPARFEPLAPVLIIPPPANPGPPPCDEDEDEDCKPPPPPPPQETPEPATIFILLAGALALWWGLRGLPSPARVRAKNKQR